MSNESRRLQFIPVSEIIVGPRIRKKLANIDGLASSMSELGLLQPILITHDKVLLAGYRRLAAAKKLGWKTIEALIVNFEDKK
jgi:ParB family transcriptional regulator, chromosome partitioning protein